MKIKVTLEFEIDPQTWATEYGLDIEDAKADAQNFIPTLVREYVGEMSHIQSGVITYLPEC